MHSGGSSEGIKEELSPRLDFIQLRRAVFFVGSDSSKQEKSMILKLRGSCFFHSPIKRDALGKFDSFFNCTNCSF